MRAFFLAAAITDVAIGDYVLSVNCHIAKVTPKERTHATVLDHHPAPDLFSLSERL